MLTRKFVQSKNCIKEIESAVGMGHTIVPLKLEAVGLEGDFLGPGAQETATANYIRGHLVSCTPPSPETLQGDSADDFKLNVAELVVRIKAVVAYYRELALSMDRRGSRKFSRKFSQAGRPPVLPLPSAKPTRRPPPDTGYVDLADPTPPDTGHAGEPTLADLFVDGVEADDGRHARELQPPEHAGEPRFAARPAATRQPRVAPPLPSAPPPSLQASAALPGVEGFRQLRMVPPAAPNPAPNTHQALSDKDAEIALLKAEVATAAAGRRRAHRTNWRRVAAKAAALATSEVLSLSPPPPPPCPPPSAATPGPRNLLVIRKAFSGAMLAALQQDNHTTLRKASAAGPDYANPSDGGGGLMSEVANTLKLRRNGIGRDSEKGRAAAAAANHPRNPNPMFNQSTLERASKISLAAAATGSEASDCDWSSDASDS